LRRFSKYFLGHEFQESIEYRNLYHRCFGDRDTEELLSRTLVGKGHSSDISAMQDVLSTSLRNVSLNRIKSAASDDVIQPKVATDPKENMETIIVKGLEGMRVSDFVEGSARYKHSSGELSVVQLVGLERQERHFKYSH